MLFDARGFAAKRNPHQPPHAVIGQVWGNGRRLVFGKKARLSIL
jgi:hypothetical protein